MLNHKSLSLLIGGLIFFILACPPAMAKDPESPGYSGLTLGAGGHWFSFLGVDYVDIEKDKNVGFHAGVGFLAGVTASAGAVVRLGNKDGLYASYHYLHVRHEITGFFSTPDSKGGSTSMISLTYGAIPSRGDQFMWDVGVCYFPDAGGFIPALGLGVSF